jgi:hypothetical protein
MNTPKRITNLDLYKNKYDEETLIHNIKYLSPSSIIETQKNLSNYFLSKYILATKYNGFNEDNDITMEIIMKYKKDFRYYSLN